MNFMHTARDSANTLARVALTEHAALILTTAQSQGKLEDENFREDFGKLRVLVGPLYHEDFLTLAKSLWARLDKSKLSPYKQDRRKGSRKIIKGAFSGKRSKKSQDELDEMWAEAMVLQPTEAQWISDAELWGWIEQFEDDERFVALLLKSVYARGVEKTLEDLGRGISQGELIRKIEVLDLTMSELRLLQLVLKLLVEYQVNPISVPENPEFEIPEGVGDGSA
jgi:hypothetical protein